MTPSSSQDGTPLQAWISANGISSAKLERAAHVTKKSMIRYRRERHPRITLPTMIQILSAARRLSGKRVEMHELFVLEPDEWPH